MSSLSSLLGGAAARVVIRFADADTRETVNIRQADGRDEEQYLFQAGDNICGTVELEVSGNKKLEHQGVKVELIGLIEMLQDRSNTYEFTSLVRELEAPGELTGSKAYPFEFTGVEKQYESYDGINVRLRYFVRVTITRQYSSRIVHEETIRVHVGASAPPLLLLTALLTASSSSSASSPFPPPCPSPSTAAIATGLAAEATAAV